MGGGWGGGDRKGKLKEGRKEVNQSEIKAPELIDASPPDR